jgi:hypothetical protein
VRAVLGNPIPVGGNLGRDIPNVNSDAFSLDLIVKHL